MSIELNAEEKQVFDAAKEGRGCDIDRLMHEIPLKDWQNSINHMKQYAEENHAGFMNTLAFNAYHPMKFGETTQDNNSLEVSIGLFPSPMLYSTTIDLSTGQEQQAQKMCRNFRV